MAMTILVTGATGTIGSQVLKQLAKEEGVTVRAGVRSPADANRLKSARVTLVEFDYDKPDVVAAAVRGADKAFLLTPFVQNQVEIASRFIDLAKVSGVKHIVKLSAFGADAEPGIALGRAHRAVEKHLEASGIAWTILRPNNFMENFINFYAPDALGNIYLPWGQGACSFTAAEDVGAVAVSTLTGEGHLAKTYTLTGPEALTIGQAAEILATATGRAMRYVDVPEDAAKKAMMEMKMPPWMVDGLMELHAIDKAGYATTVTSTVKDVLGKPARLFRDFAKENAAKWKI